MAYRPFFCNMREERLWSGGPVLETHDGVFPLGTDSVLLADFCNAPKNGRVCDLGSGTGFLLLRLLWENPGLTGTAAEIEPAAAENSRVNLLRNGLSARGTVFAGDLRMLPGTEEYDLAVSNPPYFSKESPGRSPARKEMYLSVDELCASAYRLLKPGGRFCIVHRLERLPLLLGTMYLKKLFPSRLRYVRHRQGKPVKLVLLEGVKDCETEMLRLPDLIMCHLDGTYTQETKRIYRMEERA
ncbi:MAG: methyltransferase [Oscillospiraceae bacterium]|nr:methyltransferase [Oscillospiraceae bacterium]